MSLVSQAAASDGVVISAGIRCMETAFVSQTLLSYEIAVSVRHCAFYAPEPQPTHLFLFNFFFAATWGGLLSTWPPLRPV